MQINLLSNCRESPRDCERKCDGDSEERSEHCHHGEQCCRVERGESETDLHGHSGTTRHRRQIPAHQRGGACPAGVQGHGKQHEQPVQTGCLAARQHAPALAKARCDARQQHCGERGLLVSEGERPERLQRAAHDPPRRAVGQEVRRGCGQDIEDRAELPEVDDTPDRKRPAGRCDQRLVLVRDLLVRLAAKEPGVAAEHDSTLQREGERV
mmetsp:Transcript_20301/g.51594  ORF Transcript_20301/g.51594 Transcript_20301/m.51594 type:complete len:211 (+) Transcript_20301:274-906(+)